MRSGYLRAKTRMMVDRNAVRRRGPRTMKEFGGRRRMVTAASAYTVAGHLRSPDDVMGELRGGDGRAKPARPPARNRRVWASVEKPPEQVIENVLVDGDPAQIERIEKIADRLAVEIAIALDFIHVLPHLWEAANALCGTWTWGAQRWVCQRASRLLEGTLT